LTHLSRVGREFVRKSQVSIVDRWHESGIVFEGRPDALVAELPAYESLDEVTAGQFAAAADVMQRRCDGVRSFASVFSEISSQRQG
jgi:hypothetical protein